MPPKTAVIVVHGVADQKRGNTVQSVVDLLLAESENPAQQMRYESRVEDDVSMAVPPLEPLNESTPAKASTWLKSFRESWRLSWASDYRLERTAATKVLAA